jgi:hypothetical protein
MAQRTGIQWRLLVCVVAVLSVAGCDLLDPVRPSVVPDVEVFGNLVSLAEQPDAPGEFVVQIKVSPPRLLEKASREEGDPPPPKDDALVARVVVTDDTVVLQRGLPGDVQEIAPGTELVVVPMAGTSRMRGTAELELWADALMDFDSYRRWRLPDLEIEDAVIRADATKINSDGIERGAVPVGDGSVLYFNARRRVPAEPGGAWQGAARDGLGEVVADGPPRIRTYRAERSDDGWSAPELVAFPGLDEAASVAVSWVADDELSCFVTVIQDAASPPWAGESRRRSADRPWGPVQPLEALGEGDAAGAHRLREGGAQLVFSSKRHGGGAEDLFILGDDGAIGRLELEVNSAGPEVNPRVGLGNQLFFTRGDRAMTLREGRVSEVRPGWPHRALVLEAAPTADGQWVFLTLISFAAGEPDLDLMVAPMDGDGTIGLPVPVDEWRPEIG